jgi:hypothetical protein
MKGFKGASRGLEKDFQGLEKGFKSFSPSSPVSSGKGHFKLPLKGTFEGGGSDPAPLSGSRGGSWCCFIANFFCLWQNCLFDVAALMGVPLLTQQQQYCHLTLRKSILSN